MKNLFAFAIALVILVLAGTAAYYFIFRTAGTNVTLEINKPDEILVGSTFPLSVSFSNNSDKSVNSSKVSLILPSGMVFEGLPESQRVKEVFVGDLLPQGLRQETFRVTVMDSPNTIKTVTGKIIYKMSGGSAVFEVEKKIDLSVGQSSLDLGFKVPESVFSGENFEVVLEYRNNSGQDLKNAFVRIDYPPVFQFNQSNMPPSSGNNYWSIGDLRKGNSGIIIISGFAMGQADSTFHFRGVLGNTVQGQKYELSSQTASVAIKTSPLSLEIQGSEKIKITETATYYLDYKNNSTVPMENAILKVKLVGEMFDLLTLKSAGSLNSIDYTITWNTATTPALRSIPPGGTGQVSFSTRLKQEFPIRKLSDKNFALKVNGQIESQTVPPGTIADKTLSIAKFETKILGVTEFSAKGYHNDPGSISNDGPYPPKVNQPTEYTIYWTIKNYSTDLSQARVSAFLLSGSRFTGIVKSNIDSEPFYNASSGEIVWDIGNIPAGRGVLNEPIQAVFQIENTPALNQIGTRVDLFGPSRFTAHDEFGDAAVSLSGKVITTDLPDDAGAGDPWSRRVQP